MAAAAAEVVGVITRRAAAAASQVFHGRIIASVRRQDVLAPAPISCRTWM
jgi:hypothetical protein